MLRLIKQKYNSLKSDNNFSAILNGSFWALAGRIISTGLGLIFNVFVARLYGAESVGIIAIINSFLMLTTILTVVGTPTSILRLIPEHLAKYSVASAYNVYHKTQLIVIVISLVTGALFYWGSDRIAEYFLYKPAFSSYLALASIFIVFKSIMYLNTQAIRGLHLIKLFAMIQTLPQGISLILVIVMRGTLPIKEAPLYAILLGFGVTGIFGWVIMETAFRKKITRVDTINPVKFVTILSVSLPMLLTSMMVYLIGQTGIIILGRFNSEVIVGHYAIAVKLATLTTFIFSAVESMAAPKFSELFHANKIDELFQVAKKSTKLIFYLTVPILASLLLGGKFILGIVFGQEFILAYHSMVLLIIGQFFNSISGSTGIFMNMTGNQNIFSTIMLITAILNIVLNLKLIPLLGINGAAISGMISLILWNSITLVYMKLKYGKTTCYFPISK